ncbi:MAG: formylglycine-generating enzyme family protein, partial [Polyangiales bacterium]
MSRRGRASIAIVAWTIAASTAHAAVRESAPLGPPLRASDHASASDGAVILRAPIDEMIAIAAGTFTQGSTTDDVRAAYRLCKREPVPKLCELSGRQLVDEGPPRKVTLSKFFLDRSEVTVAAYRRCARAGRCSRPGFEAGDARFDRDELPVTYVRWDDAVAYCAFRHARLPTEAEWERAARGISARDFPWGSASDGRLAN